MAETIRSKILETCFKRSEEKTWAQLRIPEGQRAVFSRAMFMARELNRFTDHLSKSEKSEWLNAFEAVVSAAFGSLFEDFYGLLEGLKESPYTLARYTAQDRDGFRCIHPDCRKSHLNEGFVESHHIIPRSHALEHKRLFGTGPDVPENLATLCSKHHELVTNPPTPQWTWNNLAPRFYELIGEVDRAAKFREQRKEAA
jgi:hypothetical protein